MSEEFLKLKYAKTSFIIFSVFTNVQSVQEWIKKIDILT